MKDLFFLSCRVCLFVNHNSDRTNCMLQAEEKNEERRHFCLASLHHGSIKYLT